MKRLYVLVFCAAGCGSNADVAGDYTISLTKEDNGCMLSDWNSGDVTTNVPVQITQANDDVTAMITGPAGAFVTAALGSSSYNGKVDGDHIDLTLFGTRSANMGNCTYTFNSEISGDLSTDTLTGRVDYRAATNGNPDCTTKMLTNCDSFQNFNGTRPPP